MDRKITYAQAICEATDQAFQLDPSCILIGQGTRHSGHIFGTVHGLYEKYGPRRVIEMPLAEASIMGICIGAALSGLRPIYVLQRADFLFLALDQLINHAAKWHFMFGGQAKIPLVIRCIIGKGWGQGPQHSQSLHSICSHFPGLRVVFPSQASDAKGLLLNSIFSDDPVVFFEDRPSHNTTSHVSTQPYIIPFGRSRILHQGHHITVVAMSYLTHEASKAKNILENENISIEVLDLISANPIDFDTLEKSVNKTKRLVLLDTSWKTSSISTTIAAEIQKRCFNKLKSPIEILSLSDIPTPTAEVLEKEHYPNVMDIVNLCKRMMSSS